MISKLCYSVKNLIFLIFLLTSSITNAQLSGTYTIGTSGGEDYNSLTNPGGFFDALNTNGLSGNVTAQITSDLLNESGAVPINQWSGPWTVVIVPQSPSVKTIQHSGCSDHLIFFNKADNLTIDGRFNATGTDRFLHFNSACNDRSVMRLDGDCQNVTIRNCVVASDNNQTSISTGGAIHVDDSQISGSDNLIIKDNLITDYSGVIDMFDGIQVSAPATSGEVLSGLVIEDNEFVNFDGKGLYLMEENGEINAAIIRRNSFCATMSVDGPGVGWAFAPIQIESGKGHNIRANWMGGSGPKCAGSKMDINLSAGTQLVTFIRMKNDLPIGAYNDIDSNIIRNLNIQGSPSDELKCTLLRIESGNNNIGSNDPNFIGDVTVDASTALNASIVITENNSSSHDFRVIYDTSPGETNIANNFIGGILIDNNSNYSTEVNIIYSNDNGTGVNVTNNKIGGVSNNIVQQTDSELRAIRMYQNDVPMTITGNAISGLTANTGFSDDLYGIRVRSGSGAPIITDNTIENCIINGGTSARMYGIGAENPGAIVSNNTIQNVSIYSSMSGVQFYGIRAIKSSTSMDIINNIIQGISLTNTASSSFNIMAIYTYGSGTTFNIRKNFIAELTSNSSSNSTYIRGVNAATSAQTNMSNNVILLDNGGNASDLYLYGIYSSSSSGTQNIYFNTIDVRGTSTGSRRSACLYINSSGTRNSQSNIFNNKRQGGSGGHYAIYHGSTSGTLTHDYNLLYVEADLGELVYYSGNRDFSQWQGLGFAANSINPNPIADLVDPVTGEPTTNTGVDIANGGLGINDDHVFTGRPIDFGHDMGAFEIPNDTLILPINLTEFTGQCTGDAIYLLWQTKSESNNDYFVLEWSLDGYNWNQELIIDGAENSTETLNYEVTLEPKTFDVSYYRLKQVDLNGESETFHPISVICDASNQCDDQFFTYNNSHSTLNLDFGCFVSENPEVQIFDIGGRLVFNDYSMNINLNWLIEPGVYIVRTVDKGKVRASKFVVE